MTKAQISKLKFIKYLLSSTYHLYTLYLFYKAILFFSSSCSRRNKYEWISDSSKITEFHQITIIDVHSLLHKHKQIVSKAYFAK